MTKTFKHTLFALVAASAMTTTFAQPQAGDWEFTLGGGGGSDTDFDNGNVGVNGSFGYFYNPNIEVALRQNVSFVNAGNDEEWAGSTRLALDYHFLLGKFVPLVGVTVGLDYNEDDSQWGIGPEVGFKYYVHEKTFVFAIGEYRWMFDELRQADNNADDGAFAFTVGVGFAVGGR